jgi:hypothetical protein
MTNILLIAALGLQVATQVELGCLGFIHDAELPMNVYVSGTEREGTTALASAGGLVYLSGPGIPSLKPGETYYVSRTEGVIRDRLTSAKLGIYYMELGTVRIQSTEGTVARAEIVTSCRPMMKGDIVLPAASRAAVEFSGELSDRFTPFPSEGLASSIILGREDAHEMAAGQFCFIGVGARDGVRIGDRFTVYRAQPPFEARDFLVAGTGSLMSYEKLTPGRYPGTLIALLKARKLPPRPVGDIVIVDMAESTSAARIINSREEIHLGDIVVKR